MSDLDPTRPVDPATGPAENGPAETGPAETGAAPAPDLDATTVTPVTTTPLTPAPTPPPTSAENVPTYPVEQPLDSGVAWASAVPVKPAAPPTPSRARRLRWAAALAVGRASCRERVYHP